MKKLIPLLLLLTLVFSGCGKAEKTETSVQKTPGASIALQTTNLYSNANTLPKSLDIDRLSLKAEKQTLFLNLYTKGDKPEFEDGKNGTYTQVIQFVNGDKKLTVTNKNRKNKKGFVGENYATFSQKGQSQDVQEKKVDLGTRSTKIEIEQKDFLVGTWKVDAKTFFNGKLVDKVERQKVVITKNRK